MNIKEEYDQSEAERLGEMHTVWSSQYERNCVVAYPHDSSSKVIEHCIKMNAYIVEDDEKLYVVAIRHNIGPELWTHSALTLGDMTE